MIHLCPAYYPKITASLANSKLLLLQKICEMTPNLSGTFSQMMLSSFRYFIEVWRLQKFCTTVFIFRCQYNKQQGLQF